MNEDTPGRALGPKGEATRQRLLTAAEEVFGSQQYHGASISEITRRAGVAQGTFYLYFPTKLAIYRELVQHLSRSMRRHIAMAVSGINDRMAVERRGLQAFLSFVREHHYLYRIVREAEFVDEDMYRWFYRHLAEGYRHGLTDAAGKAQVRNLDPETLAYCLMGVADFIGMRWVLWEDQEPPQEVFETVMAFIAGGLQLSAEKGEKSGA